VLGLLTCSSPTVFWIGRPSQNISAVFSGFLGQALSAWAFWARESASVGEVKSERLRSEHQGCTRCACSRDAWCVGPRKETVIIVFTVGSRRSFCSTINDEVSGVGGLRSPQSLAASRLWWLSLRLLLFQKTGVAFRVERLRWRAISLKEQKTH